MELILIRHADANWQDREWEDDWERPLTRFGRRQAEVIGKALGAVVEGVEQLLTTPLVRARETAEIVGTAAGWPAPSIHDLVKEKESEPDKTWATHLLESFQAMRFETLAYVGHDPTLSKFISLLLVGEEEPRKVEMDRAAAALVTFERRPESGTGLLRWLLVPSLLEATSD